MTSVTSRLGQWAADLSLDAVPGDVQAIAKRAVLDTTAVIIAGSNLEPVPQLRALHASHSPADRAMIFGTAAHALDYDDTCFAGVIHGSAQIWPAVMAIAQANDLSGAEILAAFIAGSEVCYAVGAVFNRQLYDAGWIPSPTLGPLGAAAAAAKALGLNADGISRAIGLAAVSAVGLRPAMGTMAKPILIGRAARLGVESAQLAAAGVDAPVDALAGRLGVFERFGAGFDLDMSALETLGGVWRLRNPGLVLKRFPLCSCSQAGVEAVLDLMADHRLGADDLKTIQADVMPMITDTLRYDDPQTPTQAMFSIPYPLAVAALSGTVTPVDISVDRINDPAVQNMMKRVTYATDETVAAITDFPEAARITLTTTGGARISKTIEAGRGDPRFPMAAAEISDKVHACTDAIFGVEKTTKMIAAFDALDQAQTITDLFS